MGNWTKVTSIIALITPFLIAGMTYINSIKAENQALKIDYLRKENKQTTQVMLDISKKLDSMYTLMSDNDTAIKLLDDKVSRHELEIKELNNIVFIRK